MKNTARIVEGQAVIVCYPHCEDVGRTGVVQKVDPGRRGTVWLKFDGATGNTLTGFPPGAIERTNP